MEGKFPAKIRDLVVIDRKTGDTTRHMVELPPGASFEERIAGMKAMVPPDLGPGRRICGVKCDGCGAAVNLDYDNPRLPGGWAEREDGDFCPNC
jgi:hypothetical protein